jgi:glycine/D-amino acid oxidase-like deaminating enzyme
MQEYAIDCEYHASGNIMAVVHPSHAKRLREATEAAIRIGARMRFIEAGEMRERGLPRAFLCGALEEAGGTLHPGKLVTGLRRAALARGIRVHEQTGVLRVERGRPLRVVTPGGTLTADKVLMAANAFATEIGHPGERVVPLYVTLFESEPLSDAQLAAIGGWPGREGVYTTHESLESYRLTARRTIIGGSKGVRYFYDCKPHHHGGAADASREAVVRAFRERFPALAQLPVAHTWSGWIGMTLNFLPLVGRAADNAAYHYSVGYNGHGVAQAAAMGGLIADLMLGRANPWQQVICRKPLYLPPRPLRWLVVRALLGALVGMDKRVDRRIVAEGIGR